MEQLNKVELRGIVGSVCEKVVGDKIITRLTVATNYVYKANDGSVVIETTWHTVSKWSDTPLGIQKGDSVEIIGRIRNYKHIDIEGNEKSASEILAYSVIALEREPLVVEEKKDN